MNKILEGISLLPFDTQMETRVFRVVGLGFAMLVSLLFFTGCVPIYKHFSEDRILAHRSSGSLQEQIVVRDSGWADRLLWSWEPNYWHYNVKDRHYFYVTNAARIELPFLARKDGHPAFITPMTNGNWFAIYLGENDAVSIFNEKEVIRYQPFNFLDFPLEPFDPKIRFTDSPPRIEAWFHGHRFSPKTTFDVYIFDGDLNFLERRHDVTE